MKTPNYIIKGTDEYYDLCTIIDMTELKNRLILYAYELGYAFSYPDRPLRLTNKRNDNDYKRADIFTKFINILGLDIIGFSYTKQYYIMKMIMDELIEEGKMFKRKLYKIYTGNCEGGYIYSYHNKKGGELNSIWWQYADTWDKLETRKEKLSKIADSYHEEKFISDTICPNPESLVGKEVIISKGGVYENYIYMCSVKSGGVVGVNQEVEEMKNVNEVKSDYYYISYLSLMSLIEILNMKGFRDFQIRTKIDCYKYEMNDPEKRKYLKELDNNVSVGDEIYTMDFTVKVLG